MTKILNLIIVFIILSSCSSVQDAFSLKKKDSGDEFLVEKKNPLVLPPNFENLPKPDDEIRDDKLNDENLILKDISSSEITSSTKIEKNSKPTSIEKSILEKIN